MIQHIIKFDNKNEIKYKLCNEIFGFVFFSSRLHFYEPWFNEINIYTTDNRSFILTFQTLIILKIKVKIKILQVSFYAKDSIFR